LDNLLSADSEIKLKDLEKKTVDASSMMNQVQSQLASVAHQTISNVNSSNDAVDYQLGSKVCYEKNFRQRPFILVKSQKEILCLLRLNTNLE